MKLKKGFVIREVAGETLVVATGEASKDFHGMIKINESGKFIWTWLIEGKQEDEIASLLAEKYGLDIEFAKKETREFLEKIEAAGFFEK